MRFQNLKTADGTFMTIKNLTAQYRGLKQLDNQLKQVTHSDTNPRPGKYLTHAHSHITRAVAAKTMPEIPPSDWIL